MVSEAVGLAVTRQLTFATPSAVFCADGQIDVSFTWLPPANIWPSQAPVPATVHMPIPAPDPGPPPLTAAQVFLQAIGRYIRDHEKGMALALAVGTIPAQIVALAGTTQTVSFG